MLALAGGAVAQIDRNVEYSERKDSREPQPLLTMADAPGIALIVLLLLGAPVAVFLFQRRRVSFPDDSAEMRFEREATLQVRAAATPTAEDPSAPAEPPVPPRDTGGDILARPYIARARGFDGPAWSSMQHAPPADPPSTAQPAIVVESPIGARPSAPHVVHSAPPPPLSVQAGVDAPPATVDELARRLQTLGVLGEVEGRVALPIPPDGLVCRLRRTRGTALLLPRLESEAVMTNFAKRFDMVFALSATGEPLVFSRLQARLSEMLEMK